MDKFKKKIKSKFSKTTAESKPRRDPKLRHSASMPLRSSSDVDNNGVKYEIAPRIPPPPGRYPGWPGMDPDPNDFTRPYNPRMYHHRVLLNQFPKPPSTIPTPPISAPVQTATPSKPLPLTTPTPSKPKRPSARPPAQDFSDIPTEHLLPEFPPELKAKIKSLDAEHEARRQHTESAMMSARNAARLRANPAPVQRSISNVKQCNTAPLNIRPRNASNAPITQQPSAGIYKNPAASQSAFSLHDPDSRARYRACLASSRQAARGEVSSSESSNQDAYSSDASVYSNNSATSASTHNLPLDARLAEDPASVRRRNASSASSRSALAMRRHGLMPLVLAREDTGEESPDVLRILRGPHAAKLQAPSTPLKAHEILMPVNGSTKGNDWGIKNCKSGGAATIAGYGRGAVDYRR